MAPVGRFLVSSQRHAPRCDPLIYRDASLPEIRLCLINLLHELLMRFRYVIEGEYAVAKLEQEECAEGDDGPERKLRASSVY